MGDTGTRSNSLSHQTDPQIDRFAQKRTNNGQSVKYYTMDPLMPSSYAMVLPKKWDGKLILKRLDV